MQGAEHSPREPCCKHIGWIFAKLLVHLLNGTTFFTAGEEGSVTEKLLPVKKLFRADQNCWNTDPPGRILPEKSDPHVEN